MEGLGSPNTRILNFWMLSNCGGVVDRAVGTNSAVSTVKSKEVGRYCTREEGKRSKEGNANKYTPICSFFFYWMPIVKSERLTCEWIWP